MLVDSSVYEFQTKYIRLQCLFYCLFYYLLSVCLGGLGAYFTVYFYPTALLSHISRISFVQDFEGVCVICVCTGTC